MEVVARGGESFGACVFCGRSDLDSSVVGETYSKDGISVHQYCLYFSSGLAQNGKNESVGVCGFLVKDIQAEIRRAGKKGMNCSVCKLPGKFIGCSVPTCHKGGHFPCLLKDGFLFQHYDAFTVYCPKHAPSQPQIPMKGNETCCICLADISEEVYIYCPLCKALFHKPCVQMQACTAGGYFFRCPMCNNSKEFIQEMFKMGIAIPQRDAKWEIEDYFGPEFEDSKVCQVEQCLCPQGREFLSRRYKMLKCETCGQWMGHSICLPGHPKECAVCAEVTNSINSKTSQPSTSEAATQTESQAMFPMVSISTSWLMSPTRPASLPVSFPLEKLLHPKPGHQSIIQRQPVSTHENITASRVADQRILLNEIKRVPLAKSCLQDIRSSPTPLPTNMQQNSPLEGTCTSSSLAHLKPTELMKVNVDTPSSLKVPAIKTTQPEKQSTPQTPARSRNQKRWQSQLGLSPLQIAKLRTSSSSYPERLRPRPKPLASPYVFRTRKERSKKLPPRPRVKMLEPILRIKRLTPEELLKISTEKSKPIEEKAILNSSMLGKDLPHVYYQTAQQPNLPITQHTELSQFYMLHKPTLAVFKSPSYRECLTNSLFNCRWAIKQDSMNEFKFIFYRAHPNNYC